MTTTEKDAESEVSSKVLETTAASKDTEAAATAPTSLTAKMAESGAESVVTEDTNRYKREEKS